MEGVLSSQASNHAAYLGILIICLQSKLNLPDDANLDSEEAKSKLELGLFSYPVLQAADILLYQSVLCETLLKAVSD